MREEQQTLNNTLRNLENLKISQGFLRIHVWRAVKDLPGSSGPGFLDRSTCLSLGPV